MKRLLAAFLFVGCLAALRAETPSQILLIPLDDRPVCRQLPAQIAGMAGWQVAQPPRELLGGFDLPGNPDQILEWMAKQPEPDAVIVSLDMVGYGGLVASREGVGSAATLQRRLARLHEILNGWPDAQKALFGTVMRVSLTSKPSNEAWREGFLKFVTLRARGDMDEARRGSLQRQIPSWAITDYDGARSQHHDLNLRAIERVQPGEMDLLFGQDDAGMEGPHVSEVKELRVAGRRLANDQVQLVQGVDQLAALLVSRVLLRDSGKMPTVRLLWSRESDLDRASPYEAEPLRQAIEGQVRAAGMRLVEGDAEGVVAIQAPRSTRGETQRLIDAIEDSLRGGKQVAAASADLGSTGVSDTVLPAQLLHRGLLPKMASYSAWNTASNSVGSAVAGLGAELAAGGEQTPAEIFAKRDHLFSRLMYDWIYHVELRPKVFALTKEMGESRDRLTRSGKDRMEPWLQARMEQEAEQLLERYILPNAPNPKLWSLRSLRAELPWSRPFEVEIELEWR